ncbi:MAG: hypothetical protein HRT89_21675 [Lentisphaeria bacterium]|nr:hypothetical protein [Lentisphaeria bacterium]NQZ70672.1 hypothetical protein [Lentisphaeria bacterium]
MNSDSKLTLLSHEKHAKDKYTYFQLTVAASAIAFSVQITKDDIFTWSMLATL